MNGRTIVKAGRIFDGEAFCKDAAVVVEDGMVAEIVGPAEIERRADLAGGEVVRLDTGMLVPGFVDLQVNGGGGRMLNDDPSVETIKAICRAHAALGTTAILPTLITDTPEKVRAAVEAAVVANDERVAGFLGLHLEGPHLSVARKGAHDPALIRAMTDDDLELLLAAAGLLPHLKVTVAPESVTPAQIAVLTRAGVVISLGHTDAGLGAAREAARAGARCVTHLFNAMSPLTHREPGMVGAALTTGELYAGLIADGYHVDVAAIRIALAAKTGPGKIFLVSDAMAVTGSELTSFKLGGRTIYRKDGRLTLADGTLAGADLDMVGAVAFMVDKVGVGIEEALKMATAYPAECIGADHHGHLRPGARADFVHLDDRFRVGQIWQGGVALN
ncbi:MAG: N-acetylglucosamine-6-phosphate deacetylase [Rhizobiaceae bacterium]